MVRRWGSIQVRKNRDGTDSIRIRYEVQLPDGSRAFRSETLPYVNGVCPSIDDAETLLARRRVEIHDRTFVLSSKETVREFLGRWLEITAETREESTTRNYQNTIEHRIDPYLGGVEIGKFSPGMVLHWINTLRQKGYKDTTIRHALGVLGAAMADAVRWRLISRSPCHGEAIKMRFDLEPKIVIWTMDEVKAFIATARRHSHGNLYLFLLETGMRNGEVRALHWSDVDLDAGVVHVNWTIAYNREGKQVIREGTKTHRGRSLLIRPETVRMLKKTQIDQRKRFLEQGIPWSTASLVFDRGNGRFISNDQISSVLREICRLAGVRELSPHKLRHTSATIMVATAVSDRVAQERLGHTTNSMTRRYQHPSLEMQKAALDGLDVIFGSEDLTAS